MKKIKKFWMENRILSVLFIIVLVCLLIVLGVCFKYFFGTSKSKYGNRLEGIDNVSLTEELKNNFTNSFNNDEQINNATIKQSGKVIYITLNFKDNVTLADAQNKALASLMFFEQNYLDYYDFQYTLKGNSIGDIPIMGAKNASGNGLIWINNSDISTNTENNTENNTGNKTENNKR